jgi:hypothetical protein
MPVAPATLVEAELPPVPLLPSVETVPEHAGSAATPAAATESNK